MHAANAPPAPPRSSVGHAANTRKTRGPQEPIEGEKKETRRIPWQELGIHPHGGPKIADEEKGRNGFQFAFSRKEQRKEWPTWCGENELELGKHNNKKVLVGAHVTGKKEKKRLVGVASQPKKKKKEAAEEEQGCPNTCSVVRAARVPHHPTERPPPTEHSWCIPRGRTTEERKVPEASSGTSRQHTVRR